MPSSPKIPSLSTKTFPHHLRSQSSTSKISTFFMDVMKDEAAEGTFYPKSQLRSGYAPISPQVPSSLDGYAAESPFYSTMNHTVSKYESLRRFANRILFSKFYKLFYLSMTLIAFATVIMSFYQTCPTPSFLMLEIIVNVTLILEVSIRFFSTRRHFFSSKANLLDALLVFFCFCLLLILIHDSSTCNAQRDSGNKELEEIFLDSFLLIFRNVVQFLRIVNMLRRNQGQLAQHVAPIDFSSLEEGFGPQPDVSNTSSFSQTEVPTTTSLQSNYSRSVGYDNNMPFSY